MRSGLRSETRELSPFASALPIGILGISIVMMCIYCAQIILTFAVLECHSIANARLRFATLDVCDPNAIEIYPTESMLVDAAAPSARMSAAAVLLSVAASTAQWILCRA